MKFAIVSDVHANVEALEAVLGDIGPEPTLVHIGDIVGYGPEPNEVVLRLFRTRGVKGNHDAASVGELDISEFNEKAQRSTKWTRKKLSADSIAYLKALPYVMVVNDDPELPFFLAHGSPYQPQAFHYLFSRAEARDAFEVFSQRIAFVGHTHVPEAYHLSPEEGIIERSSHGYRERDVLRMIDGHRYIVNVGSVGQPRDGDPNASYAIFDTTAMTVTWHRVPYDIAAVQKKIRATSLPSRNATRLANGE